MGPKTYVTLRAGGGPTSRLLGQFLFRLLISRQRLGCRFGSSRAIERDGSRLPLDAKVDRRLPTTSVPTARAPRPASTSVWVSDPLECRRRFGDASLR